MFGTERLRWQAIRGASSLRACQPAWHRFQQNVNLPFLAMIGTVLLTIAFPDRCLAIPSRPHVVLIISDDQAWTDFGFMGHRDVETPNLDRLAARSAVFSHSSRSWRESADRFDRAPSR